MLLEDVRVVSIALNLPGPAACARLRLLGARVVKIEPPAGDPLERYVPGWYRELHAGIEIERLDLKASAGRERLDEHLRAADLLVTAQRPSALERLDLGAASLGRTHPRLCVVRILGHATPHEEQAGHDLTYLAVHGLLPPGAMPPTLFADMAGAERAAGTALALLHAQRRTGHGEHADVALEDAAQWLSLPRKHGLTGPRSMLGGDLAGYNLYECREGWIALAALEPHFALRLAQATGAATLDKAQLAAHFARESALHWEQWARERDIPLVALRDHPRQENP